MKFQPFDVGEVDALPAAGSLPGVTEAEVLPSAAAAVVVEEEAVVPAAAVVVAKGGGAKKDPRGRKKAVGVTSCGKCGPCLKAIKGKRKAKPGQCLDKGAPLSAS